MRRPLPVLLFVVAVVAVLAWPFAGDDRPVTQPGATPPESPIPPEVAVAPAGSVTTPAAAAIPDPDRVGPCPESHSPVLRRGLDSSGQPTWWHVDGSMTVRVLQDYTSPSGEPSKIARVVVVRPAEQRPDPDRRKNP